VTPLLGGEKETMLQKHTDDFRGTESIGDSPSPIRC
jgi:hypothetical protein